MRKFSWQSIAALVLVSLASEFHFARAQSKITEPFTPISGGKLKDATPIQSQRLEHIEHLPTTEAVHIFRMEADANVGDELKISIPNEKTIILSKTGGEKQDSKDFTWTGQVHGEERGSATLISRKGEITGSINTAHGLYRITPLGDQAYAIVKINTKRLPREEPSDKIDNKP